MAETKVFRSLIRKYIPKELFVKIYEVTQMNSIDINVRAFEIKRLLTEYNVPYTSLGPGSNRLGILIDGYAFKFAMDESGMIDNQREFKYSPQLYPDVIKVYECAYGGLIAVTEYVEIFTKDCVHRYADDMREILTRISNVYLVGDVGITTKNYVNWGIRQDGSICIMDFAYIYDVRYGVFRCTCGSSSFLKFDDTFETLYCPDCRRKYLFTEIRRRISQRSQLEEIGDLRQIGYVVSDESVELPINREFTKIVNTKVGEKKESEVDKLIREHKEERKLRKSFDWFDDMEELPHSNS